jgi:nicotinamidase-related amidase
MFELVSEKTGLVVVDMQNDFVRVGAPIEVPMARETIPVIQRLLTAFRAAGRPVVYTRVVSTPSPTVAWLWNPESGPPVRAVNIGHMREYGDCDGPRDCSEVIDELRPEPGEDVIVKYGYGAFHRTNLTSVLLGRGLDTIVVVGTVTQVCVEDTVRGGYAEGFKVALVSDAVSSYDQELHAATLRNLGAHYCRLVTAAEVLTELGDESVPAPAAAASA